MGFRLTVLEVATGVGLSAVCTLVARTYFDVRDAWWKRVQWATDRALDLASEQSQVVGVRALDMLADAPATRSDRDLLIAVLEEVLAVSRSGREDGVSG